MPLSDSEYYIGYESWLEWKNINGKEYDPSFIYPIYYKDKYNSYIAGRTYYHTVIRFVNPKTKDITKDDLIKKFKSFRTQLMKKGVFEVESYVIERSEHDQYHMHILYSYKCDRYLFKSIKIPKYEVFTTKIQDVEHYINTTNYFKKTLK